MIERLYVDNYKCLVNFELEREKSGPAMAKRLDPALLSDGLELSEIVAGGWEK